MKTLSYISLLLVFLISGCDTKPSSSHARQCDWGLKQGYKNLSFSKAKGFSGTIDYTKAAALLATASTQYEFGKYPNCINNVRSAIKLIKLSRKNKKQGY